MPKPTIPANSPVAASEFTSPADDSGDKQSSSSSETDFTKADFFDHPLLWRAKELNPGQVKSRRPDQSLASGYSELDQELTGRGWPRNALVEILLPCAGLGELRLLLPTLAALSNKQWIAWINPPFIPYAPALEQYGVDMQKILIIQAREHAEALWAVERCSQSACCGAVIAWPDQASLTAKQLRRAQLAARSGNTLGVFFRPLDAEQQTSPAELRLKITGHQVDQLSLDILKRRGGWPLQGLAIDLSQTTGRRLDRMHSIHVDLAQWQKQWQKQWRDQQQANSGPAPQSVSAMALEHLLSQHASSAGEDAGNSSSLH